MTEKLLSETIMDAIGHVPFTGQCSVIMDYDLGRILDGIKSLEAQVRAESVEEVVIREFNKPISNYTWTGRELNDVPPILSANGVGPEAVHNHTENRRFFWALKVD